MIDDDSIEIHVAIKDDIPIIHELANQIWPNTYKKILSELQLLYMMELIYSEASLQKQFESGHNFLVVEEHNKPIAFADYGLLKENIYKLHKIYALPESQGKGIGKMLLHFVVQKAREQNATELILNVNRHNKAKQFYERLGFKVIGEEDIDIGEGYFMNDFIMSLKL